MLRTLILGTLLMGAVVWLSAAPAPRLAGLVVAPTFTGPARVVDGDSLIVAGIAVRLHGIDAPERAARCLGPGGSDLACGQAARRAAIALVDGRTVTCIDLGERTYDRVVAQCHAGGQDIAAALIAQGVALSCPRYAARHPHAAGYLALERQAAAARLGLHAGTAPPRARYCRTPDEVAGQGAAAG